MKTTIRFGTALALSLAAASFVAMPSMADNVVATESTAAGQIDAGKLIGKNVIDANGDTVGEIDSVMVDGKGKVKSVVLDVSGWLQSEKLISVAWSDLQVREDGDVTTALMKDDAQAAAAFKYDDDTRRRKVLTEDGEIYADTGENTDLTTSSGGDGTLMGTPVMNADGSINASQLVGVKIEDGDGTNIGEVGEIVVSKKGNLSGVVVDVGGFLGVGEHHVLLPWKDITISGKGDDVTASVATTKENLKSMPEYPEGN